MAHAVPTLPPTVAEVAEAYAKAAKALATLETSRTLTVAASGQSIALTGKDRNVVIEVLHAKVERLRAELVTALQSQLTPETSGDKPI
tara:strand:- start:304 stop:567 length:264 start_codon:yes stop_codon:yes gene_type:complete